MSEGKEWGILSSLTCSSHMVFKVTSIPTWISSRYEFKGYRKGSLLDAYVIIDQGLTNLEPGLILQESYLEKLEEFGDDFTAKMGGLSKSYLLI